VISPLFDESGKFQNQPSICFGGVAAPSANCQAFADHWDEMPKSIKVETLSMKDALRFDRPLSEAVAALGTASLADTLLPFIECIRKHVMFVTALAVKSSVFNDSPERFKNT